MKNKQLKLQYCTCGGALVKNGRVKRVVQTLGGKVTYIRTRMLCKSCGKNYYPLDETMEMPSGIKHSMRATEAILDMVTDLPYAKTSRYMDKLAHIEASPQKIAGIVSTEGAKNCWLEAKVLVERWKTEYNTVRPHSSLNYQPPAPEAIKPEWIENAVALS